jgi:hypothetical protein
MAETGNFFLSRRCLWKVKCGYHPHEILVLSLTHRLKFSLITHSCESFKPSLALARTHCLFLVCRDLCARFIKKVYFIKNGTFTGLHDFGLHFSGSSVKYSSFPQRRIQNEHVKVQPWKIRFIQDSLDKRGTRESHDNYIS